MFSYVPLTFVLDYDDKELMGEFSFLQSLFDQIQELSQEKNVQNEKKTKIEKDS